MRTDTLAIASAAAILAVLLAAGIAVETGDEGSDAEPVPEECEHDFINIILEPSCTERGTLIHVCKKCGYAEETPIPPRGHRLMETVHEPTCTRIGSIVTECKNCG